MTGFCRACQSRSISTYRVHLISERIQVSGFQIREQMSDQYSRELSYAKNPEMLAVNQLLSHVWSCSLRWHHLRELCMHMLCYVWHSAHTHAHVCQKDSRKKNRPLQRNNVLVFPVYSSPHIVFVSLFLLLSCPPSSVTHSLGQCVRQPGLLPGAVGEVRTHRSALAVWNGKNNHNLTPPLLSLLC